jgi:hypothetical protein
MRYASEEELKRELDFAKKKRAEAERIAQLKREIDEEKRKFKELMPSFWRFGR